MPMVCILEITMSRFKACAKVAHAKLRTFFPQLTHSQTLHVLAGALGHASYHDFLKADAPAFDEHAAFAVLDPAGAMLRASALGAALGPDHWRLLMDEINDKQVAGSMQMLEHSPHMGLSAVPAFLALEDDRIDALMRPHGGTEVFRRITREHVPAQERAAVGSEEGPASMSARVQAEIGVERTAATLSVVPVQVEFSYRRVGKQLYGRPELVSIVQAGAARFALLEDEFDGGMTFGP